MTSMNFIAAMNTYVLSPAQFYINRKYYEDITRFFPNHIMAFLDPRHESDISWNDNGKDEDVNFPIIVEVEIPSGTDIEIVVHKGNKLVVSCMHDKIKAGKDILLLLPCAIPLSSINQVLTPGEKTMKKLKNNPYIKDVELSFEITALSQVPSFSGILSSLNCDSVKVPVTKKSCNVDMLEKKLSMAGGSVVMGEATWCQSWTESMGYSSFVLSSIASIIQADSGPTKIFNAPDYSDLDGFQESRLPYKDESISCLGNLARLTVKDNFLSLLVDAIKAEKGAKFFNDSNNKFVSANTIAFTMLIHETINSNPDTKSVTEIIDSVSSRINESCKDFKNLRHELERIHKGLQLIKGIVDGTEDSSQMFHESVSWATSLRAASLFALRSSPNDVLGWKNEDRPDAARIADYYAAAFLAGNYTGFTRLPLSVKDKWKPFIHEMIKASEFGTTNEPEKMTQWKLADSMIIGTLSLVFPDNNIISVKSKVDLTSMVKSFVDSVYERIGQDKLKNIEKSILAIIANQNSLTQYKLVDITLPSEKAVSPRDGSIVLTVPEKQIKSKFRWDYKGIANHLADASGIDLSAEIIALLCYHLDYRYYNLEYYKEESIEQKISGWLSKMKESISLPSSMKIDHYCFAEIHKKGIELLGIFIEIIDCTKLNQQQEHNILETFLYFAVPTDIISENIDPDLGMIDDWIIIRHACDMLYKQKKALKKLSKKSESKKLESMKKCSDDLFSLIRDEFGVSFVNTIISKFDLGKSTPGKKITARKDSAKIKVVKKEK